MAQCNEHPCTDNSTVVIITDSRGYGLQTELDKIVKREGSNMNFQVFVWRGRGISGAVKKTSKQLIWMAPALILVSAGICDVTHLDKHSRQISLSDDNVEEAVQRYEGLMDIIRHHLTVFLSERPFKVVFCELIGANIAKYNNQDSTHYQQEQLDETVTEINTKIAAFNKENKVPTPWIAKTVQHNKKSGSKVARYQKLCEDGLHYGDELKVKIADILYNYVVKFSSQNDQA